MHAEFFRDSALPYLIESRRACQSRICYKMHSHPSYSIGVIDAGQSHFKAQYCGEHLLHAGQIILIPAQQAHSCNPLPNQTWSYQMLHLDAIWVAQLQQELTTSLSISQEKIYIFDNQKLYQLFCETNQILFSDIDCFSKEIALLDFLSQLLGQSEKNILYDFPCRSDFSNQLIQSIHFLNQDPLLSLEQLAKLTQLSRYQIIRLFKQNTGLTPHHFQLNLRINRAKNLLIQKQTISDIAYQLGFADQSHFQRTFKSFTGITPQQYSI